MISIDLLLLLEILFSTFLLGSDKYLKRDSECFLNSNKGLNQNKAENYDFKNTNS